MPEIPILNNSGSPAAGRDPFNPNTDWYALLVRPQHERSVAQALAAKNIEAWAPTRRVRRAWSDRMRELETPLFPGYVFSRFVREQRRATLETPGVLRIVSFNGSPAAIDEAEISAIRRALDAGLAPRPCEAWRAGQRVRIDQGPLAGTLGVLQRESGEARLVLEVTLLQRAVSVEIDERWATPLAARGGAA